MKLKNIILLALTTCTLIVIGTGIAKAVFIPRSSFQTAAAAVVIAQSSLDEQAISPEAEAINQATLEYLQEGRENLPEIPNIRRTVINQGYALSTWMWGEASGQALLAKTDDGWIVLANGGGAVDVFVLEGVGVPISIAEQLTESDQASWAKEQKE
ncbi:MAG: hypothetical protein WA949_10455 [Phormidesmis sp.]